MSMVSVEQIIQIPFLQGLPAWALRIFAEKAAPLTLKQNDFVIHQHDEAQSIFFLLSGAVQFFIHFEGVDHLMVGTQNEPGTLLGWSAFRAPFRYTASVRAEEESTFLKIDRAVFDLIFEKDPALGFTLLKRAATTLANRLESTRDILVSIPGLSEKISAGY